MSGWKPAYCPSVSPYVICPDAERLIAFLGTVFGGRLVRRFNRPDGSLMHAEIRIDDSIVMIGGGATDIAAAPAHIHLSVPDAVAAFDRAVEAGAKIVQRPVLKNNDDDLRGGVQDSSGTIWWFATR